MSIKTYILLLAAISCSAQTVTLTEGTTVASSVIPIGVNMGSTTPYGPGQFMKNLMYSQNPGMQGIQELQIIPCTSGTATSCTGFYQFDQVAANFWTGASCTFVATATNPTIIGRTVTITTNTATGTNITYNFSASGVSPTLDDYMECRLVTPVTTGGMNSWQCFSGAMVGESGDIPTNGFTGTFTGSQAASLPSGTACFTGVDAGLSGINHDFVIFQTGQTFTWKWLAKAVSGTPVVTVAIQRQGGVGGVNSTLTFSAANSNLSGAWATQSATFSGNESTGTSYGTLLITISVSGGTAEVANLDFERTSNLDGTNTSAYRDEVVAALRAEKPGSLRFVWTDVAGQTLDNWITDQYGQLPNGWAMGGPYAATGRDTVPTGQQLPDFLALCELTGAKAWLVVPATWTTTEYGNLMDYLFGGSGTTYGLKRINGIGTIPGHSATYASTLGTIYIEFTDEPWNTAGALWGENMPQLGSSTNTQIPYGMWSSAAFAAMKAKGYSGSSFKLIVNQQACCDNHYTNSVAQNNANFDAVSIAPYTGGNLDSCTSNATCYNPQKGFAWGDTNDAATTGNSWTSSYVADNAGGSSCTNCQNRGVYVYEDSTNQVNAATFGGTYTELNVDQMSAVFVTGQLLEHLKILPAASPQNIWQLAQQNSGTTDIWGTLWEAGGEFAGTGSFVARPMMLANGIANNCMTLGTQYAASFSANTTFSSTANNGVPASEASVPSLFAYPFKSGSNRCLVLINTDFSSHTITLAGSNIPTSAVQVLLTPTAGVDSNNETGGAPQVSSVTTNPLTISAGSVTLPAFSVQSLTWTVSGGGGAPRSGVPVQVF